MESYDGDTITKHESEPPSRESSISEDFAVAKVKGENEPSSRRSSISGDTEVASNQRDRGAMSDRLLSAYMFVDMTRPFRTMSLRVERELRGGERRHVLTDIMDEIVRSHTVSGMWNDLVEWVADRSSLLRQEIERGRVSLRTLGGSTFWETSRTRGFGKLALLDVRNFLDSSEARYSSRRDQMLEFCLIVPATAALD